MELLLDLTNRVVSTLDLQDLLRVIAANLRRVMQSDAVGMQLPDAESGRLRLHVLDFPGSNGVIGEGFEPPADSTAAQAFRTGEPLLNDPRELASYPIAAQFGIKSACHLPLTSRERVLGVLSVCSLRENAFSQNDLAFFTQFARQ